MGQASAQYDPSSVLKCRKFENPFKTKFSLLFVVVCGSIGKVFLNAERWNSVVLKREFMPRSMWGGVYVPG